MIVKDALREIRRTFGRFASILVIVALGVGFYAGVKIAPADLRSSVAQYVNDVNLYDIHAVATLGITDDDLQDVAAIPGVERVMPAYSADLLMELGGKSLVVRTKSLPTDSMNALDLVDGRVPIYEDECLIVRGEFGQNPVMVGDIVTLLPGKSDDDLPLHCDSYLVVGEILSPEFISFDKGYTNIGSGSVSCVMFLPPAAYDYEEYSDIYIRLTMPDTMPAFSQEYHDALEAWLTYFEDYGEGRSLIRERDVVDKANDELADARVTLAKEEADAKIKLDDAQVDLDSGKEKIDSGNLDLADGKIKVEDGEKELSSQRNKYNKKIKDAEKQLNDSQKELNDGKKKYDDGLKKYNDGKKQYDAGLKQYNAGKAQYDQAKAAGMTDPATEQKLAATKRQLDASKRELDSAKKQLDSSKKTIDSAQKKLNDARKKLNDSKAEATREFAKAQKKIDDAKKEIRDAEIQLIDGQREYDDGVIKLADARKDADEAIADAHIKIDDAQEKIDDIPKSEWLVSTRVDDPGYGGVSQNADRVDSIARIFPLFFILVAALVCSTNMTRMVEESRTQIGTLKALGYSPMSIAAKFVIYALLASLIGSICGLAGGLRIFPYVIYAAYGMVFDLPPLVMTFPISLMALSVVVSVMLTTLTAVLCCYGELRVSPASLMRPRAPKPGKRILLERVTPIWKHISFSYKVTLRNLFRYKQRILMTVAGIAGCTALMLAGFGLSDSIDGVPIVQYNEIYNYGATILLKDDATDAQRQAILTRLYVDERVYDALPVRDKTFDATNPDSDVRKILECHLLVTENVDALNEMITLRDRKTHVAQPLALSSTVLTEKIAHILDIKPGGAVTLTDGTESHTMPVDGIAENYLYHYLYTSKEDYEQYFGEAFTPNSLLITYAYPLTAAEADAFSEEVLKMDGVLTVLLQTAVRGTFSSIIDGLSAVTLLIITSAGLLAFVVLYNLITVNILERVREIATIKVLGFTPGEVAAYVFRENLIMVLIGLLVGLFAGVYLHQFIISTAEMDQLMFTRILAPSSFMIASALTLFFALCVVFAMYFKLKSINMVESLKSLE